MPWYQIKEKAGYSAKHANRRQKHQNTEKGAMQLFNLSIQKCPTGKFKQLLKKVVLISESKAGFCPVSGHTRYPLSTFPIVAGYPVNRISRKYVSAASLASD